MITIENNIEEFNKFPDEQKRAILWKLVYYEVMKNIGNPADKIFEVRISGMLIDKNVFTIEDIIQLLKDPSELQDRIEEALALLK